MSDDTQDEKSNIKTEIALIGHRLSDIEAKDTYRDVKVDELRVNIIPDMEQQIIALKTQINIMSAVNVGSVIIGIIVSRILK